MMYPFLTLDEGGAALVFGGELGWQNNVRADRAALIPPWERSQILIGII